MPNMSAIVMERGIGAIQAGVPPGFVANAYEHQVSEFTCKNKSPSGTITDLVRSGCSRVMSKRQY
jgi:hypothetical protein